MAYKDYLRKVKDRNRRLIGFKQKNPSMTNAAIAKIFKLSRERVRQILQEEAA